ncbi:MAG: AraC family transcriptional regulator [Eubacteriales bacterium]|nr:AraC family transcriptional regulator [Eubacteriales bacterium]
MNIKELMELTGAELLTKNVDLTAEVESGYSCDLLSWVMAHGKPGMAWITVQTHMNVVAVATLHDMACVIVPEGANVPDEVYTKAEEEGIAMFSSPKSAFELSGLLYGAGLAGK